MPKNESKKPAEVFGPRSDHNNALNSLRSRSVFPVAIGSEPGYKYLMIVTADDRRRVTLPTTVKPGDHFDIEIPDQGKILLRRIEKPAGPARMTARQVSKALKNCAIKMKYSWEDLRQLTREP